MAEGLLILGQATEKIVVPFVIIFGLVSLVLLILLFQFGWLFIQAAVSGAPVSFMHLIAMKLRRVNARTIVIAYIAAQKAKLDIRAEDLEIHYMAGGDVSRVVNALLAARASGAKLSYDHACAIDLSGQNVFDAAQTWVSPIILSCPLPESGLKTVNGVALDGIQLKFTAKVIVRANLERFVGGYDAAVLVARIGEEIVKMIGDSPSHKELVQQPGILVEHLLEKNLDHETKWQILGIEIVSVSVGENVVARLQAEQHESDRRIEEAWKNRNMD